MPFFPMSFMSMLIDQKFRYIKVLCLFFFLIFISKTKEIIFNKKKMNVFFDCFEMIGINTDDIIILKNLCIEYNSNNIYEFLKIKIPITSSSYVTSDSTWPLYHKDGLHLNTILVFRALVGLTIYMEICPRHFHTMKSMMHHNGIYYLFIIILNSC